MEIKSTKISNRAQTATSIIKNTERVLNSSVTQFIDGTPIECNYYSRDYEASSVGLGYRDNSNHFDGGVKYKFIKNYIMYGYNEVKEMTKEEREETGVQYQLAENTSLHLPMTIVPKEGDLITLHIENNQVWYIVSLANQTTFHNKPYIRTEWVVDKTLPHENWSHKDMVSRGLITEELLFIPENVGTEYSAFLQSEFYDKIQKLEDLRIEINSLYVDYFYDEFRNIFTCDLDNALDTRVYFPIIVDFQMEFKPLYVYDVNMVLHHETIVNPRSLKNWKKSALRKFIKDRNPSIIEDGHKFNKYIYITNTHQEYYKLCSFLNDDRFYEVYDYGDDAVINVPEAYEDIFRKYCNRDLTLKYLLEVLPEVSDLEIDAEYLLYTPVLLAILDVFLKESLVQEKIDRFY